LQDIANTEATRSTAKSICSPSCTGTIMGRWAKAQKHLLVVLILMFSDILLAMAVWQAAIVLQVVLGRGPLLGITVASMASNAAVWIGLRATLGVYPGYGLGVVEELRRQTLALLATLTIIVVVAFASQIGDSLSRILLFAWSLGLLMLAPVVRYCVKRAMARLGIWGKPVVVLGAWKTGLHITEVLQREWQLGFKPVGVFDNRLAPTDRELESIPSERELESIPCKGTFTDALTLGQQHRVDTAIFAMPHTRREHLAKFVSLASNRFRHILLIPNLNGITNSGVVARDLAGTFAVEIRYNLLNPWAQRFKRVLDISATVVGGVLVLPLIMMLSLLVWIESGRPVFYMDRRMGQNGRLFSCIKFRTMVSDAEALLQRMLEKDAKLREEYMRYHKLRNDPRTTRIGCFLRKTSLDELPQLWNVLCGDMSLVGPRPYLPRESEEVGVTKSEILRVPPGITGPWQVTGRNHTCFEERVNTDAYYVRDWSIWLDLVLLARTVKIVLSSRGAY
jgi:Undecaprenyl-phosphate galactose phosphotransferase WbaP